MQIVIEYHYWQDIGMTIVNTTYMKKLNLALTLAFMNAMAFAQEKAGADINVDVNKGGDAGGSFPWMYLIGAIVLILLLFALLGGRGGSDRIVERKTIVKE